MGFFDDRGNLGPPPEPFRLNAPEGGQRALPLRWMRLGTLVLVGYLAINVIKSIYVDLLWFDSVGFQHVFQTELMARVVLFFAGAAITIGAVGGNVILARRFAPVGREESFIEDLGPEAIRRMVTVLLVAGTLFLGVIFGTVAASGWETVLLWMNGQPFGRLDPQFQRDISFYVFTLPALHFVQQWFLSLLMISAIASGGV